MIIILLIIIIQSNPAISNSVNSKSPIEFPWIYPSPLRFPGYFETPLFRTFFHFPWDFEIAGFDCKIITINLIKSGEGKGEGRGGCVTIWKLGITPLCAN